MTDQWGELIPLDAPDPTPSPGMDSDWIGPMIPLDATPEEEEGLWNAAGEIFDDATTKLSEAMESGVPRRPRGFQSEAWKNIGSLAQTSIGGILTDAAQALGLMKEPTSEEPQSMRNFLAEKALEAPGALVDLATGAAGNLIAGGKEAAQNASVLGYNPMTFLGDVAKGAIKHHYEKIPEGQKAEGIAADIGAVGGGILSPLAGPVIGGTVAPFIVNQGKQLLGMAPDTPLGEDLKQLSGNLTTGLMMGPTAEVAGGAVARGVRNVREGVIAPKLNTMQRLLDKDANAAGVFFTDPSNATTRQGVPLVEAMKDPVIRTAMEVPDPPTGGTRLTAVKENLFKLADRTGESISKLLDRIRSPQTTLTWGDLKQRAMSSKAVTKRTKGYDPTGESHMQDVLFDVETKVAKQAFTKKNGKVDSPLFNQWKRLANIRRRIEGGNIRLSDPRKVALWKRDKLILDQLQKRVDAFQMDINEQQLFKMGMDYNSGYDKKTATPDVATRAEGFKAWGSAARKIIQEHVDKAGLTAEYDTLNSRYQTLQTILPLAERRIKQKNTEGAYFSDTSMHADPTRGMSNPRGVAGEGLIPEASIAELRLVRANRDPLMSLSRPLLATAREIMRAGHGIMKTGETAARTVARGATTNPAFTVPIGSIAGAPDMSQPPSTPIPGQAGPNRMSSILGELNPLPQNAQATELPPQPIQNMAPSPVVAPSPVSAIFPRDTDAFFSLPEGAFAGVDQDTAAQLKIAKNASPVVRREILAKLVKEERLPFEQVQAPNLQGYTIIDNMIVDPLERKAYADDVMRRESRGELTRRQSTKIRKALNSGSPLVELTGEWTKPMIDDNQITDVMKSIAKVEAKNDPDKGIWDKGAVSPAGAEGPMQMMPAMQKAYGLTDPTDPVQSMVAARKLFSDEVGRFQDMKLAIAAYNAGSPAVFSAMRKAQSREFEKVRQFLPAETKRYVDKVMGHYDAYQADNKLMAGNMGSERLTYNF